MRHALASRVPLGDRSSASARAHGARAQSLCLRSSRPVPGLRRGMDAGLRCRRCVQGRLRSAKKRHAYSRRIDTGRPWPSRPLFLAQRSAGRATSTCPGRQRAAGGARPPPAAGSGLVRGLRTMVGGVCWRRPPTAASALRPAQQQSPLKSEAGKRPCRRGDDDGEGQVVEVADGRGSTEAAVAAHGNGEGHPGGARDGEGEGTHR